MELSIIQSFFPFVTSDDDYIIQPIVSGHINVTFELIIKSSDKHFVL